MLPIKFLSGWLVLDGHIIATPFPTKVMFSDPDKPFFPLGSGAFRRRGEIDLIINHWTGGEGGGDRVCRTLSNRGLGVEFIVDTDGTVYQMGDPAKFGFWHAREHSKRGIGIEAVNYGFRKTLSAIPWRGRARKLRPEKIHGRTLLVADFNPAQLKSIYELNAILCDHLDIPDAVPYDATSADIYADVIPNLDQYRGVLGHFHLTRRKKDPGLEIFRYLRDHGFAVRPI